MKIKMIRQSESQIKKPRESKSFSDFRFNSANQNESIRSVPYCQVPVAKLFAVYTVSVKRKKSAPAPLG